MLENKNILVTGGCGYIGSHVCRQLSEAGANVTVIDNLSTGFADALINNERLIEGDVGDETLLNTVMGARKFDVVMHFAAALLVEESVAKPIKYYQNNVENSLHLLRAVAKHDIDKLIFSSTAAVYGEGVAMPVSEDALCKPNNPYGWSKLMIEQMIRDVAAVNDLRFVILRYFNVAGADPELRMGLRSRNATHLVKLASEVATGQREKLFLFGDDYPTPDGTCLRDYIHVEDLASAHLSAARYLDQNGESATMNCGYGIGYSVKEVIDTYKRVNDIEFPAEVAARRAGDVSQLIANVEQIRSRLDWQPRFDDLDLIVKHAFEWEQLQKKIKSVKSSSIESHTKAA
ncbi:MAG: UDP-glucose 4-epimerase GalE [Gammaproteobacteria bacterium]|nr:UDP-glucose 4-epimerase GalE [Gammaproteobacteria bacterium]